MKKYCLDANVLIEPWNKYYSIALVPDYWEIIDDLAQRGILFCPDEVKREIEKVDDGLHKWIKDRPYIFKTVDDEVQIRLREIMEKYPRLIDTKKDRSMADPWVIAQAIVDDAIVVTKEAPTASAKTIKIPDVCNDLSIEWMDDHRMVSELGIRFAASIPKQKR